MMMKLSKKQEKNLEEQGVTFVSRYHQSKDFKMRKQYGISLLEYDEMLEKQGNRCLICLNKPTIKKRLSIDHCHETGKVRGLICNSCNLGLGCFKDKIESLHNAVAYLNGFGHDNLR
jgi:hypothetical protein